MMKRLYFALFMFFLVIAQAHAFDRVSSLMQDDAFVMLDQLTDQREELKQNKEEIRQIEAHIKTTSKGQNVYLQLKNVAGSIIIVGIIIGSYKAKFPPGLRAMMSAYVTMHGLNASFIKLNNKDLKKLSDEIQKFNTLIKQRESQLRTKFLYYCDQEPTHPICCTNF